MASFKQFRKEHVNHFRVILGNALLIYGKLLMYSILPILFTVLTNEWKAGLILGAFNIFQAFFLNPFFSNLADRLGCKRLMQAGVVSAMIAGIIWVVLPFRNLYVLLLSGFFLFTSYTLGIVVETYLLRISKRKEGGIVFGLSEDIYSVFYFLVAISVPFFTIYGNQKMVGFILIGCSLIALIFISNIKNDVRRKQKVKSLAEEFNFINTIKHGVHFIKANNLYPLLTLSVNAFEAMFYGTIWFVFPLYISSLGLVNFSDGLILGVYEIVTICLAGLIGYLADRYNWRNMVKIGWVSIIIGTFALPFYSWPVWLIFFGFVIGFGNNLSAFSSTHALEAHDVDHKEDGAYIGMKYIISDVLYSVSPIIAGFVYFNFGFSASLLTTTVTGFLVGVFVLILLTKLRKKK